MMESYLKKEFWRHFEIINAYKRDIKQFARKHEIIRCEKIKEHYWYFNYIN